MFGLTFSNPAMLYGLWASLIPILIHLLNRRRSVTVAFSNVALLQTLQQDRMRRVRVKQWVLLALRTLLIALLVMAFARPTIRDASFGRGHGATAGLLLVDRSMSMRHQVNGRSYLEQAKERATQAVTLFDEGDVVQVIGFDRSAELGEALGPERAGSAVSAIEATFYTSDIVPALDAARRDLRASDALNRELYLFSDMADVGWRQAKDPYDGLEGATIFVVPPEAASRENATLSDLRTEDLLLATGRPTRIVAEVTNTGTVKMNTVSVHAFADDQRIGQTVISLEPAETSRLSFRFTPRTSGAIELRVELSADDLLADNVRSRVFQVPDQIRVAVVGDAEGRYYVEEGLAAISGRTVIAASYTPGSLTEEVLSESDLIVLCGVSRLGRGEIAAIERRVRAGAGLLAFMGEGVDVRLYNEHLLPAFELGAITGLAGSRAQRDRFSTLDSVSDHPVLNGLVGPDLKSPRFYLHYNVQPARGARTLLSFSTGGPALLEKRVGRGSVLLLATHTDLEWSDLPVSGFFPPFLHRVVQYLATGAYGSEEVAVGARTDRLASIEADRDATVKRPDGSTETLWAQQLGDRSYWVIDEVTEPGVWEIISGARAIDRFAAQVDVQESDLARVDETRLRALLPGADVVFVEPNEQLADVVSKYRYGAELWRYFLMAALLCAAVELLLMAGESRSRG